MILRRIIVFCLIPILFVLSGAGLVSYFLNQPTGKQLIFDIPSGDNLSSITRRLQADEVLPVDDAVFKAVALLTRDEGAILAGQYQIAADMNTWDLLALFRSGKVVKHKITFPEGWTLNQWMLALTEAPYLSIVTTGLNREALSIQLGLNGDPEGWFFPDTYVYIRGDTDLEILRLAHGRMKQVLDEEWQARGSISPITNVHEALTLASMIEKETGFEPDRVKIASVFHNRLNRGMKLQSDPTVIYGLGDQFDGNLTRKDLRTDSPFNTYTRKGLPLGPICSPGRASIHAALGGSAHGYLYFVAMGEGKSYFSTTLENHNQAVSRYQIKRNSNP